MPDIDELIASWDGLAVVVRHDRPTGTWIFVALDDATLGRPVGGTRIKRYPAPADGLLDAQRLARGMTEKWAAAGLPFGGGKAVLALSRELSADERAGLLARYGRLVEALSGAFATGQDLGASGEDMRRIGRETRWIHGLEEDRVIDPGPYTARGVFATLRGVLRHLDRADGGRGEAEPAGRSILVEGVGDVGEPLARRLAAAGATLLLADLDRPKAEALAAELDARVVPVDEVIGTRCDVYAPCAVGGTLSAETIPRLACRAVCGSANNQLATDADADALHRRGILYAPDYVANSGGAINFGLRGQLPQEEIDRRIDGLEETIGEILAEADATGHSPLRAARRRVERILRRSAR